MGGRTGGSGRKAATDNTTAKAVRDTTPASAPAPVSQEAQQATTPDSHRYERETDKAVLAKISIDYDGNRMERTAWIPKSQIKDGQPSDWIIKTKAREILEKRYWDGDRVQRFSATVLDADNREVATADYDKTFDRWRR